MIWAIARTGRTARRLTLAAGLIAAAMTFTGPAAASASTIPGARLLAGPPAVLSVPADGRVNGYGFTATVLGAATAHIFDGQPAGPGAQWWLLGLRWQVDPVTPASAVSMSVVADGQATPLPLPAGAATSPDTGPLYWAVPEPVAASDVTVQAVSDGFTQTFSLTHLARPSTDPPVLYRTPGQWQTTVPVNRTDTLPVRGFQGIPASAVQVVLGSVTLTDFGPTGPNDTPPAGSGAWLTVALTDQETSTVESVQTPVTANQVTLTLPGQPAIPATLTPGGGPDDPTGIGLFPDRYAFPVPADITTATLTITPTNINIEGGITTITTTLTPATFTLTLPPATVPPAPARPALRPRHYDTVGTAPTTPTPRRHTATRRSSTTRTAWTWTVTAVVAAALVGLAIITRARRRTRPTPPPAPAWTTTPPPYRPPTPTPASPPIPTSAPPASPTAPPTPTATLPARPARPPDTQFQPPAAPALAEGTVEIGVLGPIILAGWPGPEPPKATIVEVLSFLAVHPERTWPTERLLDQINPGRPRPLKPDTLRTYLAAARQTLGADRIPESGRSGYTLTGIGTDWDRYQTHRTTDPAGALALVRGPVGAQPDRTASYDWLYTGPLPTRITTTVLDDAATLGRHALHAGQSALARWAASKALLLEPTSVQHHQLSLQAAATLAELDTAWKTIGRAFQRADEPVPAALADTYRTLQARQPAP